MSQITLVALILFAITYVLMLAFQKIRPHIVVTSAVVFVALGVIASLNPNLLGEGIFATATGTYSYGFADMLNAIDWNVIMMIAGTMGTVYLFIESKKPQLMSDFLISKMPNMQWAIVTLSLFAGIVSAFVDNGKPGMFWVVEAGALVSALIILFMFRKEKGKISFESKTVVEDKFPTLLLVGTIVALIAVSFIPYDDNAKPGQLTKPDITNGIICIAFFAVGLIRELFIKKNKEIIKNAFKEIDYYTIVLLTGLFVVIGGIEAAGVVQVIGNAIASLGSGNTFVVFTIIVWMSVILSAFIDNIPYTATMLAVVPAIGAGIGLEGEGLKLLYYGLLCGATLGGNLTPIGASANITGIGILRKEGYEVKATTFMKFGVPFTLAAVITGYLLIWFIWK